MMIDNTTLFSCYLTNDKLFKEIVIIIYNETTIGFNQYWTYDKNIL